MATSLYRVAMTGLIAAAKEAKDAGTFGYVDTLIPTHEISGGVALGGQHLERSGPSDAP